MRPSFDVVFLIPPRLPLTEGRIKKYTIVMENWRKTVVITTGIAMVVVENTLQLLRSDPVFYS